MAALPRKGSLKKVNLSQEEATPMDAATPQAAVLLSPELAEENQTERKERKASAKKENKARPPKRQRQRVGTPQASNSPKADEVKDAGVSPEGGDLNRVSNGAALDRDLSRGRRVSLTFSETVEPMGEFEQHDR